MRRDVASEDATGGQVGQRGVREGRDKGELKLERALYLSPRERDEGNAETWAARVLSLVAG
jgi:hypothetical protein